MTALSVRTVCAVLSRKRLLRIADGLGVEVDRRAAAAELGEALDEARRSTVPELLEQLTAPEWVALCRACDVSKHDTARGRLQPDARASLLGVTTEGRGRRPQETGSPDNKGSTGPALEVSVVRAETDTHDSPPDCSTSIDEASQLEVRVERGALELAESAAQRADSLARADQHRPQPRPSVEQRRRRARARLFVIQPLPPTPVTRADCLHGPRPCPWTGCEFHLARIQKSTTPAMLSADQIRKRCRADGLPAERPRESCVLDVTDRGEQTLEQVAGALGVTRERVRQIQREAIKHASQLDEAVAMRLHEFLETDGISTPHIRVESP